ncbi:MAG: hypothetical protein IPH57_16460 [Saprospiraceae bacterium]|nr:hypothetical protein [Saprospiraceae bacterium]
MNHHLNTLVLTLFLGFVPQIVFSQVNTRFDTSNYETKKNENSFITSIHRQAEPPTLSEVDKYPDFKIAKTLDSGQKNNSNASKIFRFKKSDFVEYYNSKIRFQHGGIDRFKDGNFYFLKLKTPQKINIDYAFRDFHNIYFSGTEKNDIDYATGKDMYYSRRGYFLSANDNNPRYMYTQGEYNNTDDIFILLWLFDIFSEIGRK